MPPQFDADEFDDVWTIEDDEAIAMTAGSPRRKASSPGSRPARTWSERCRLAEQLGPDAVVVTLAVDSGFKYMTGAPYASAPR